MNRARHIPKGYLRSYCLKGVKDQAGTFMIDATLKRRIKYMQINLNEQLPHVGEFNVIVLRNVMIYFDTETKRQVIERIIGHLKSGGYLFIGHSESLNGITDLVELAALQIRIWRPG